MQKALICFNYLYQKRIFRPLVPKIATLRPPLSTIAMNNNLLAMTTDGFRNKWNEMMKFGSSAQATYGITPAASVSVGDRLAFIKKVYGLLALSLVTAAIGAHLGSDPALLLIPVASNMMLFFILQIGLVFLIWSIQDLYRCGHSVGKWIIPILRTS